MRTFMLYGALALGGCTAPEMAFPSLADLPQPAPPKTTVAEHEATLKEVQRSGDATRNAATAVRSGANPGARPPG